MAVVVIATIQGVVEQTDEIGGAADSAIATAAEELGVDPAALEEAQAAAQDSSAVVAEGLLTKVASGIDATIALAGAVVLGALIMFYLLKDGSLFRRTMVERTSPALRDDVDWFIGEACRILRDYGKGRTAISGIVAVVIGVASLLLGLPLVFTIIVVNFIGGYIPYIGAFLGGGLAVIVALGEGGIGTAVIMLLIVLAANLLVENFVEPKVMGQTLDIHPLTVLGGHRDGWHPRRHRRSHPRRAVLGHPHHGHRTDAGEGLCRASHRQGAADHATHSRVSAQRFEIGATIMRSRAMAFVLATALVVGRLCRCEHG